MKKKILVVTQNFFPETFPINDIIFKMKEFTTSVLTTYPTYPNYKLFDKYERGKISTNISRHKNTKIIRVPSYPRKKNTTINFVLTYLTFLTSGTIYGLFFYRKKIDYIFVYATSPVIQALIGVFLKKINHKNAKLIVWVQDLWPESIIETGYLKNKLLIKLIDKLINYIYKSCDIILTQSETLKINIENKVKNKQIFYLPNPSKNFFLRNKTRDKKFNILYAGNLGKVQNLHILLKLAKKLKNKSIGDIDILIAGKGSEEKNILNFKKKNKLNNLKFLGLKNFYEMKKLYSKADLVFLSLKKNNLSKLIVPSKFQAYLSSGKPIFTTLDGEVSKIIRETNCGFFCNTTNINIITNKIIKIKNMPSRKLVFMGKRGKDYFSKNFSNNIIKKKLVNYILKSHE